MENWRFIKENNDYMVSDHGRIMSLKKPQKKILSSSLLHNGYEAIYIYQKGIHAARYVHRLVAETFIPNPKKLPQVNHLDGAHCMGWNKRAIGICYVGGLDKDGRPADTRTDAQRTALIRLVKALRLVFPGVKQVLGHRDTSPDLNGDGVISPNEYMKACPCFDVQKEGF